MIAKIIIAIICAIALAPVVCVTYYSTNDGPVHLGMATHFANIWFGEKTLSHLFFRINSFMTPNSAVTWLSALGVGTVDPVYLEKIVQVVCVVLPIVSSAWVFKAAAGRSVFAASLIAIMVHNQLFQLGLYSFVLGVGLWIVLLALIMRKGTNISAGYIVAVFILFTALYWIHGFVCAIGIAVIVIAHTTFTATGTSDAASEQPWSRTRWNMALPMAAILPAILVVAYVTGMTVPLEALPTAPPEAMSFDTTESGSAVDSDQTSLGSASKVLYRLLNRLWSLLNTRVLTAFGDSYLSVLVALLIWSLAVITLTARGILVAANLRNGKGLQLNQADFLLFTTFVMGAIALVLPDNLGGGWSHARRAAFMTLTALALWVSAAIPKQFILAGTVLAISVASGVSFATYSAQRSYSKQTTEVVDLLQHIDRPAVVLPVVYSSKGVDESGAQIESTINPMYHVFNRLEGEGNVVVLGNFLARLRPYPVRFRDDMNPYRFLFTDWAGRPVQETGYEILNVKGYETGTRRCVDVLAVYGRQEHANPKLVQETQRLLDRMFVPVACSDNKLACVYRRSRHDKDSALESCFWVAAITNIP